MDLSKLYYDDELTDCTVNVIPFRRAVLYCSTNIDYFKNHESLKHEKNIIIIYNYELYDKENKKMKIIKYRL
jgi:hypothetical protein